MDNEYYTSRNTYQPEPLFPPQYQSQPEQQFPPQYGENAQSGPDEVTSWINSWTGEQPAQSALAPQADIQTVPGSAQPPLEQPAQYAQQNYIPVKPKKRKYAGAVVGVCVAAVLLAGAFFVGANYTRFLNTANPVQSAMAQAEIPSADTSNGNPNVSFKTDLTGATAGSLQAGVANVVNAVKDSVVSINLTATQTNMFNQQIQGAAAGSGIIFGQDNTKLYVVTNNHVISGATKCTISLDDSTQVPAHYVGSDTQADLAVIAVLKSDMTSAGVTNYKVATFGDSSKMQVGDLVVAIGNALGEGKTATMGIVSAIDKNIDVENRNLNVMQTDAAINPGNSGGALVNAGGEIIGINTAKLAETGVEGMGYSIPTNEAKSIVDDIMKNGDVQQPYLGIQGTDITQDMMNMYNMPSTGVYVVAVTDGSGAAKAGLQKGDLIVGFNSTKITSMADLQAALKTVKVGSTVQLHIYQGSDIPMTLKVTIGNMNSAANF